MLHVAQPWLFALQIAASTLTDGHPYKEWISTYGSPEYEELPQKQEELLNAVGPAQPYGAASLDARIQHAATGTNGLLATQPDVATQVHVMPGGLALLRRVSHVSTHFGDVLHLSSCANTVQATSHQSTGGMNALRGQVACWPADELLAIARKVADLDLMLLTDLPGIETLPLVRVMVVSFGAAWAGDDVLFSLENPLAWAAEQAAGAARLAHAASPSHSCGASSMCARACVDADRVHA